MTSVGCRHPLRIYVFTRIFGRCKLIYLRLSDPTNSQAILHVSVCVVAGLVATVLIQLLHTTVVSGRAGVPGAEDDDWSLQPGRQADHLRDADAREHVRQAATDSRRGVRRRQRHPRRRRLRHAERRDRQGTLPGQGRRDDAQVRRGSRGRVTRVTSHPPWRGRLFHAIIMHVT